MKKRFIGLLILVLCAFVQFAYGAAGDVASIGGKAITAIASVDGKATAGIASFLGKSVSDGDAGAGQWLTAPATITETLTNNSSTFILGTNITVPGSGTVSVTKIAFKVKDVGNATTAHAKFTENADSGADIYGAGSCTPSSETWCVVSITPYNATGGTTYRVVWASDGSTLTEYGDADAGTGSYAQVSGFTDYDGWIARTDPYGFDASSYGPTWAVAICYGGTCAGNPE